MRASTFQKKKKKTKFSKIGNPNVDVNFNYFHPKLEVLREMILRAQFLLHLQVLYSKMFAIVSGIISYDHFKKMWWGKGRGEGKEQKKNGFHFFFHFFFIFFVIFLPNFFFTFFFEN